MAKAGCTSWTKWTISFEVSGFRTKTHLLQRDFIFLNLFELQNFCVFKMHHSKPHHKFSTISDFICYFSCSYWFFLSYMTLKLKSTTNELRKGWKLAWYHHFAHIAFAKKLRGLRQKLDALREQNWQSLLKYQGFGRKLICYKRHFISSHVTAVIF
jgi:hypothetical protein